MLILDNTIKQIINELICEYWEDDVVISNTRMDELMCHRWILGFLFMYFKDLQIRKIHDI